MVLFYNRKSINPHICNFLFLKNVFLRTVFSLALILIIAAPAGSQDNFSNWKTNFIKSLNPYKPGEIKKYFSPDFAAEELESWKYNIENGFLTFDSTRIFRLSDNAILFYVPTNNKPYSGKNEDFYFDFIYRIYEITPADNGFIITKRIMNDFNPDFIKTKSEIEFVPEKSFCLIKSKSDVELKTSRLIFKLAKEFEIDELLINNKKVQFINLGYIIYAPAEEGNITLSIKGKVNAPNDHNQFFSIDSTNIFIRLGGFPVVPSPPPDNTGKYYFSKDSTEFDITYIFPKEFQFVQYGSIYSDYVSGGKRIVSAKSHGDWTDNLSFYSQKNWSVKFITSGNSSIGFYFPKKDSATCEVLTSAVNKLFDWTYSVFSVYPKSELNFIVLDKFVENGALNDSRSVIAQNAEVILDDTYIHEVLHGAPQPKLKTDYLWIKEGFTNYLSFNYIDFKDNKNEFWEKQKRYYINAFDQFSEPLYALTSTRMPTYWTAYQKGPWIYRMIESIIGKDNFKKSMSQFGNLNGKILEDTREYFNVFENISGMDLSWFQDQWLNSKENPVLRVENTMSLNGGQKEVNIKIVQEGKPFQFPLDIDIVTESNRFRKTIRIDSVTKEYSFPIDSKLIAVNYDPDAKLFAVIKTGKTTFLDNKKLIIPRKEIGYKFVSAKDKSEIEYKIIPGINEMHLICKNGNIVSDLEVNNSLSPIKLKDNSRNVYSIDYSKGKIDFGDGAFDIPEPVYSQEHIIMLYLCVDWTKTSEESFLFRRSNRKRCAVSYAKCEKISNDEIKLTIDNFVNTIELFIRNGVPVRYIVDKEETFELVR
jgi:hypothetical protein